MTIVNAMTVDVEDYFMVSAFDRVVARDRWHEYESRVAANTDRLLTIFAEFGVRATFFVLGWVAERDGSIVRRIAEAGHEVASHGYGHRLIYELEPEAFREDVRRARRVLQDLSGQAVNGYRAPSFSITQRSLWALDVLIEEGYTYDTSIFPIRHDRYGIPDAPRHPYRIPYRNPACQTAQGFSPAPENPQISRENPQISQENLQIPQGFSPAPRPPDSILEIPASTIRIAGQNLPIAGGGYFRLLPFWWTRFGIRRVNEVEGKPVVFYLHPWEVDPDQPRLQASALSKFRHYRNLAQTLERLRSLLLHFRFDAIDAAFAVPGRRQ